MSFLRSGAGEVERSIRVPVDDVVQSSLVMYPILMLRVRRAGQEISCRNSHRRMDRLFPV